jgi:hypothetical protein
MNSYDAQDHGDTDRIKRPGKRPWVTPSLQVIPLKSAEAGAHLSRKDGGGGKFNRPFS